MVPQPNGDSGANGGHANGDQTEVTEKVIETLTDAVRQRIRTALDTSASGGAAADRRGQPGAETGKAVPDNGTEESDGDADGPSGPDAPGPPRAAGDDAGT